METGEREEIYRKTGREWRERVTGRYARKL